MKGKWHWWGTRLNVVCRRAINAFLEQIHADLAFQYVEDCPNFRTWIVFLRSDRCSHIHLHTITNINSQTQSRGATVEKHCWSSSWSLSDSNYGTRGSWVDRHQGLSPAHMGEGYSQLVLKQQHLEWNKVGTKEREFIKTNIWVNLQERTLVL